MSCLELNCNPSFLQKASRQTRRSLRNYSWRGACLGASISSPEGFRPKIQQMEIFLFPMCHCQSAASRLWVTGHGGASADVGMVIRAEQPRTTSNKEGQSFCRSGRLLKLNFQLVFTVRRAPQTLGKRGSLWAGRSKAHRPTAATARPLQDLHP
jgi:hypothetical protein